MFLDQQIERDVSLSTRVQLLWRAFWEFKLLNALKEGLVEEVRVSWPKQFLRLNQERDVEHAFP